MEFSESFFINICTLIIGLLVLIIRYIYRSKCEEFSICFNLFKFKRNTNLEAELEKFKIDHNIKESEIKLDIENNNK